MTKPTIRTRVALWYGAFIVAVLLAVGAAVSMVYERIGLGRVDNELEDAARTLDGVVFSELREQSILPRAARGAVAELNLPGTGVAVLDTGGHVLATRASTVAVLPADRLALEHPGDPPRTLPREGLRVASSRWQHGSDAYVIVVWASLAPLERERSILQNTLRTAIPVAAVLAMLGGWLIGRWALRPLTAMAADAATIDHRRLDRRLTISHDGDELGHLGTAFNAVLDRLASIVQAQRRFMADASHEMRTPVSIAQTAAQVTLAGQAPSETDYREALSIIETQTRRLTRVVGDMFMLALADLDARPIEPHDLYLNELVADCARAAGVLASARRITMHVDVGATDVSMHGDEGLLKQLVMNLLDNAVRHASDAGEVRVELRCTDHQAQVTVEDSGPGIPVGEHSRVFERFVRIGAPHSGSGAGLGLAIARWIAEQHGGTLRLAGEGATTSRFVLTLPLDPAAAS